MTDLTNYRKTTNALAQLVSFLTESHQALNHLPEWLWDKDRSGIDFNEYRQIIRDAEADIAEFVRREEALTPFTEDLDSEDAILMYGALRIDGYRYQEMTRLDVDKILKTFYESGTFGDVTALDKLASLFLMQRYLCKWGGERLPRNSVEWKVYRQLFLDTAEVDPPPEFRANDEHWSVWEYRLKPRLKSCIKTVAENHQATSYTAYRPPK